METSLLEMALGSPRLSISRFVTCWSMLSKLLLMNFFKSMQSLTVAVFVERRFKTISMKTSKEISLFTSFSECVVSSSKM